MKSNNRAKWIDSSTRVAIFGLGCAITMAGAGCNPYAPLVGQSFSRIDDYMAVQTDEVPLIAGGNTVRSLRLVRQKRNGRVEHYAVEASIVAVANMRLRSLTLDGGEAKITLLGSSTLEGVDVKSYGARYNLFGVFSIQPDQIRQLSELDNVIVVVSGNLDLQPIRLGPRAIQAIDTFRERFVDSDGIGNNVMRSKIRTSD